MRNAACLRGTLRGVPARGGGGGGSPLDLCVCCLGGDFTSVLEF